MSWQTNPSSILNAAAWYRVFDLAALFGVAVARLEAIFGVGGRDRVQGGQVLNWVTNLGGAGSLNYIAQAGETSGTVSAFDAVDQN